MLPPHCWRSNAAFGKTDNFVTLARYHFFDNTICHRAIPAFAVQCGDPTATGSGGPGYKFADELPAAVFSVSRAGQWNDWLHAHPAFAKGSP